MKFHVSFDIEFLKHDQPGKLVAIEGIDGSGKTTQAQELKKVLKRDGNHVFFTKNPTEGEIGEFIREILAGKKHFSPISFQFLYVADRAYQQEEILRNLKKGKLVIADRYFWSSVAYGAEDRGIDFSKENNGEVLLSAFGILSTYYQFIVPDITFYLKVSAETAISRLSTSRHQKDIYDTKTKLENIAKGYDWLIKKFPQNFVVLDGEKSVEEVTDDILKTLKLSK